MYSKGQPSRLTIVWRATRPNAASLVAALLTIEILRFIMLVGQITGGGGWWPVGQSPWVIPLLLPMALIILLLASSATLLNNHFFEQSVVRPLNVGGVMAWVYLVMVFTGAYVSHGSAYLRPVHLFVESAVYLAGVTLVVIWLPVRIVQLLRYRPGSAHLKN